jgi:hypothetical protein
MNKPSLMMGQGNHPPPGSRGREFGREITNGGACGSSGSMTGKAGEFPASICLPSVSNMSNTSNTNG